MCTKDLQKITSYRKYFEAFAGLLYLKEILKFFYVQKRFGVFEINQCFDDILKVFQSHKAFDPLLS